MQRRRRSHGEVAAYVPDIAGRRPILSSYRYDNEVRVWKYTGAFGAQVVVKAGEDPSEAAFPSSRIGAPPTLAAGREVPQRVNPR